LVNWLSPTVTAPDGTVLKRGTRIVVGGGAIVIPFIHRVQSLSLEILTVDIKTPEITSKTGVPVLIHGVAQIKVRASEASILKAAELFLDKAPVDIMRVAHQTLEGHIQSLVGSMPPEELFSKREQFQHEVMKTDFNRMGLELISFFVREVTDTQGYFASMARMERDRAAAGKPCATCGRSVPRTDRFCGGCGAPAPA
jgi:flotillin